MILPAGSGSRLNDGACDPAGRFLVGSMALDGRRGADVLVRVERRHAHRCWTTDLTLSNGLAWTPGRQHVLQHRLDPRRGPGARLRPAGPAPRPVPRRPRPARRDVRGRRRQSLDRRLGRRRVRVPHPRRRAARHRRGGRAARHQRARSPAPARRPGHHQLPPRSSPPPTWPAIPAPVTSSPPASTPSACSRRTGIPPSNSRRSSPCISCASAPPGAEKPVVRVDDTPYVDVSDLVTDFDEQFFGAAARARLAERGRRADRGRRDRAVRRRADRRADRPAAPDPLHRPELPRPRRRDRPGRAGRADPVHQVAEHADRPERRRAASRAAPPRLDWEVELGIVIGSRTSYLDSPGRRARARSPGSCWSTTSASGRSRSSAAGSGRRASRPRRSTRPGRGWPPPTRSRTCATWTCGWTSTGVRRQTGNTATMVFDPYFDRALPEPVPGARARRPDQHRHPARRRHGPQAAGLAAARRRDGAGHRRPRHASASTCSRPR